MSKTPLLYLPAFLLFAACDGEKNESTPPKDDSGTGSDQGTDSGAPQNLAPTAPDIAIAPEIPLAGEALEAVIAAESADPEGDPISYAYAWSVGGAAQDDLTGAVVPAGRTLDGEEWSVTVTPSDGQEQGPPATASVHIGNQPPTTPEIHIDPASPTAGSELTLVFDVAATDPEGQPLTQTVRWMQGDTLRSDLADDLVVPGRNVHGGETWTATVTVSDGVSEVSAEASVTTINTAPDLQSVEIQPDPARDSDDLVCVVRASDDDGDPLTTSYRWFKDGAEQTGIGDTDTVDHTLTAPQEQWYCEATVADALETDSGQSATIEIQGPTRLWWNRTLDVTMTPDGAGGYSALTGDQTFELVSEGYTYGVNDCYALWRLTGTPDTSCRRCDYAFTTVAARDAASDRFNTANCSTLGVDGVGTFQATGGYGESVLSGPYLPITITNYGYVSLYNVQVYQEFGSNYYDSGYGYGYYGMIRHRTFVTDELVDSAGNLNVSASIEYYVLIP